MNDQKIQIIFLSNRRGPDIFFEKLNKQKAETRAILESCCAQYTLIHFIFERVVETLKNANSICRTRFEKLFKHFTNTKWDASRCVHLLEVPEIHFILQSFLVVIKTYLDLIVQLISTEEIVNKKIHGFHKKGNNIGGEVIDYLQKKYVDKDKAEKIISIIKQHKRLWIDAAVLARDNLAHPQKGVGQVMFELEFEEHQGTMNLNKIIAPKIGDDEFIVFAKKTMQGIENFTTEFLETIGLTQVK